MPTSGTEVLVTGAEGFIGSHLTERLVRDGYRVRAMYLYNAFDRHGWLGQLDPAVQKELEIIPGDIRDPQLTERAVAGVEIVFHLASLIGIPFSYHAPASYLDTNIRGTLNLLEAARGHSVTRFVHTSTSEVYGSAQRTPMDEDHPMVGQSPYAATKIAADQLAISFGRSYELPVTIIRPFNTYGPRQSARAVIPTIIIQLAAGQNELRLGSLDPRRDLTYVTDVVDGYAAVADRDNLDGETINLGSGADISIGELAGKIGRMMGREITFANDARRVRPPQSEVMRLVCDNSKAARLLDWRPAHNLETGLSKTIAWFTDESNLAGYDSDRYVL